jgi:hypothetical protein
MFVFAIETDGKTVAFTKETDRTMLDGVLNGQREHLRDGLFYLRDKNGALRDGTSPFTARLATESEELDYNITAAEYRQKNQDVDADESVLIFHLVNLNGESVLVVPPSVGKTVQRGVCRRKHAA